jgi:two-component system, OmpR family, KDP operon response regulator KdpE
MSRILVVDDDTDARSLISEALELSGRSVVTAASGEEALDQMRAEYFDLVLLDVNMPGIGGKETLARINASHQGTKVIMISACTSWDSKETTSRGAYGFIRKPFRINHLLQEVKDVLQNNTAGCG